MDLSESLELFHDGFGYNGKRYLFSDVSSLIFEAKSVSHSTNLVKTHNSLNSELWILFKNTGLGKRGELRIAVNQGLFDDLKNYENQKRITDKLFYFYRGIAQATYDARLDAYLATGDESVAFRYNNLVFFKDGVVLKNGGLYFQINRKEYDISKTAQYIVFEKKNQGIFGKVFGSSPSFNTQKDTDIIFPLLDHFFGLRWD